MKSRRWAVEVGLVLAVQSVWAGAEVQEHSQSMRRALEAAQAAVQVIRSLEANPRVRDISYGVLVAGPAVGRGDWPGLRYSDGYYSYVGESNTPGARFQFRDSEGQVVTPFGTRRITKKLSLSSNALADAASVHLEINGRNAGQKLRFYLRSLEPVLPFAGDRLVLDGEGTLRGPAGDASLQVQGLCMEGWVREGTLLGTGENYEFALYFWDGGVDGVVTLRTGESADIHFKDAISNDI